MLRFFKGFNCEFAADGRESLEEIFKSIPAFEILEERLDGYPRPPEHWCAVHHVGISADRLPHCLYCHACVALGKPGPFAHDHIGSTLLQARGWKTGHGFNANTA